MSLGPLLPGRIPNSLLYTRSLGNLNAHTRQYQSLQDQISTGKLFQNIGESPIAALQTILMQQQLERGTQLASNVEQNRSLLSASEDVLGKIGNVFDQMKTFVLAGLGDSTSPAEKKQMASEADTLIQQVMMLGNTQFRGRYLFGGSQNTTPPFSLSPNNNAIRFNGDFSSIESYVTFDSLLMNNVAAGETLKPLAEVHGKDLNPALSSQTKIQDLFSGTGTTLGPIEVTVDTGSGPQTARIDLTTAQTIGDLVTRLQAPFGGDLSVQVHASGIQLVPASGTVAVSDLPNSRVAARLGLNSPAAASVASADLNPQLSLQTTLSSLNNGAGVGPVTGSSFSISNGNTTSTISLDGLTTIEDLFLAIQTADPDLMTGFTADGQGLRIASRLSGAEFSIGENQGNTATLLGIRTLTSSTPLSELNQGKGVPVSELTDLEITRRDGSSLEISLGGARTIQDVLNRINAADPGVLTAALNSNGNGITLNDSSGTGPLTVASGAAAVALGIAGTEDGNADLRGTGIGISATTNLLTNLNQGAGVNVAADTLNITRRDGSNVSISLAGASTVQDVLTAVNAVDPGNLVMTFDAGSGGFRLNDQSGSGPLIVEENIVSTDLGINGTEDGVTALVGDDPNPQRSGGVIDLLFRLSTALNSGDDLELAAIDVRLAEELEEFNFQRGAVAGRLKSLDQYANTLADQELQLQESMANVYDTDMALAISQFTNLMVAIQATQQITAQSMQLNLFNFL